MAATLKWLESPKVGYFPSRKELVLDPAELAALVESAYVAVAEIDAVNMKEACEVRLLVILAELCFAGHVWV